MNKKNHWFILGPIIAVGVGGTIASIVVTTKEFKQFTTETEFDPQVQKISYFHKEIDGFNFYFQQANIWWDNNEEILFSHKIVPLSSNAYIRKSDNKFFLHPREVIDDIEKIPSTSSTFFPANPVNEVTKISALIYYYNDDANMDPHELTYYTETVNGTPLETSGYFKSKPRFSWEIPFSSYAMYKVNEGNQTIYYGGVTNSINEDLVHEKHATRISNVKTPNGKRSYRFLDSINSTGSIFDGKLGMSYNNVEYLDDIPENVSLTVPLVNKPQPTSTPAYIVNVTWNSSNNVRANIIETIKL